MKEFFRNKLIVVIIVIIVIVAVPFFLDYVIFNSHMESNLSNEQWGSFLGSYLGSWIGALTTLIVMYMTFYKNEKEKREECKLANRCYLDLNISKSKDGAFSEKDFFDDKSKILVTSNYEDIMKKTTYIYKNKGINVLELKNCGPGIVREMQINIFNINDSSIEVCINRILQNELIYIPIVYDNMDELGYEIKQIKIIFKSLSDEVCIIDKLMKSNEVEEEIHYKDKGISAEGYNYKNMQLKWTSIKKMSN